jgi:hypothetical protein
VHASPPQGNIDVLCTRDSDTNLILICKSQGVNRFIQLADDSDEVPDLKGKAYAAFKLPSQGWSKMELMQDVLQVT